MVTMKAEEAPPRVGGGASSDGYGMGISRRSCSGGSPVGAARLHG